MTAMHRMKAEVHSGCRTNEMELKEIRVKRLGTATRSREGETSS